MSGVTGPNMVTDGLTFALDAGNVQSYPGSGTTWYDIVGSINGTSAGSPVYSSADGGHFVMDGTDDYFYFDATTTAPLVTSTGSLCFWINLDNVAQYRGILMIYDASYTDFLILRCDGSTIRLLIENNNVQVLGLYTSSLTSHLGNWIYLVATQNGTNATWYINASQDTTVVDASWIAEACSSATNTSLRIGYSSWASNYMDGKLAIVQVYNRALSTTEITQNFNAHKSRFGL